MPINVSPPDDDEPATRHKFYTALALVLENNTEAMTSIRDKLDEISAKNGSTAQEFRDLQTTIRTTIKIAGLLAVALGSVSGMVLKQAWDVGARVDALERQAEIAKVTFKPHENLPEAVQLLAQRVQNVESQLTNRKEK